MSHLQKLYIDNNQKQKLKYGQIIDFIDKTNQDGLAQLWLDNNIFFGIGNVQNNKLKAEKILL